jgi:hypothetical protein
MAVQEYGDRVAAITVFDNTAVGSGGIGGLANGSRVRSTRTGTGIASGVVDNTGSGLGYTDAMFELYIQAGASGTTPFAGNVNNGGFFILFAVPTLDGTNYADGDTNGSTVPVSPSLQVCTFTVRGGTNAAHRLMGFGQLPNADFYLTLENRTGQNVQPTGGGAGQIGASTAVKMSPFKYQTT